DPEWNVHAWNTAMEQVTGVSSQTLLDKGDFVYAEPLFGRRQKTFIDMAFASDDAIRKARHMVIGREKNGPVVAPSRRSSRWICFISHRFDRLDLWQVNSAVQGRCKSLRPSTQLAGAIEAFDRALEIDEKLPHVWNDRGICIRTLGDYDNAFNSCLRATELAPGNVEILYELGETLE